MKSSNISKYNPYGFETGDIVGIKPGRKTSLRTNLCGIHTATIQTNLDGKCDVFSPLVAIQVPSGRGYFVLLDCLVPYIKVKDNYEIY